MFSEKLRQILDLIRATDKEIAEFAGFDRTNISHLRNGRRRPQPSGSTIKKLVRGIYLFAENRNRLEALCALIGSDAGVSAEDVSAEDAPVEDAPVEDTPVEDAPKKDMSADEIQAGILSFLFSDQNEQQTDRKKKQAGRGRRTDIFSERLSLVMSMTNLSNVRLGQMLHIDASLVSRYRSGIRFPRPGSEIAKQICQVLYERIKRNGNEAEIANLMHLPAEGLDQEGFSEWLFDAEDILAKNISSAEMLLESFETFYGQSQIPDPEAAKLGGVISGIVQTEQAAAQFVYYDTEGLRTAVLRFLGDAVKNRVPQLLLYSDEDQSWLTDNAEFRRLWGGLMTACVKNGTQIFIIHNIDRDLAEMNAAIANWMPLYMSGMITSFYSKKDRDSRFFHTIFLAPEMACIEAFHAAGSKGQGIYHYYTSPQDLLRCTEKCNILFEHTRPLLRTFPPQNMEGNADITILQNVLSVATMSEEMAEGFQNLDFLQEWRKAHTALLSRLERHCVRECVPIADEALLRAGKVMAEQMPGVAPVRYTPEQYALHRKNIIRIAEQYPNYQFFSLQDTPCSNMKLWITKKEVRIIHASRPELSFSFTHPLMCRAFQDYTENLMASVAREK